MVIFVKWWVIPLLWAAEIIIRLLIWMVPAIFGLIARFPIPAAVVAVIVLLILIL